MTESGLVLLVSLRKAGAQHFDPTRFHYLEVLSQRLPAQSGGVRCILEGKLHEGLAEYGQRFTQSQRAVGDPLGASRTVVQAVPAATATCVPLVQLNQYIRNAKGKGTSKDANRAYGGFGDAGPVGVEMDSVRRFRETWSRHHAQVQVAQAVGRAPENSGPFNSHSLVLQTLSLMRDLSPDYLRRFLSHVEALQWIAQASEKRPQKKGKPTRRDRTSQA